MSGEGRGRRFDWPRFDEATSSWWFKCPVGKDPETGKRRQARRTGFPTKKAAREAMDDIRHAVRTDTYTPQRDQRIEVREHLEDWLESMRGQVRASTWESYARNFRTHVIPRIGAVRLVDLTPTKLTTLYAELAREGRRDQEAGGPLAAKTVRYISSVLRHALNDAVIDGLLPRNPADHAKPPSADAARSPEMRTWSATQVATFFQLVGEDDLYYAPWFFLATTGARRGECLGVRWRDVDLDAGRASIRQNATAVKHEVLVGPGTKTGQARVIDLDAPTVAVLRTWRARQREEMFMVGRHQDDDTLLFSWPDDGRPYHPERFSREFTRRLARPAFAKLPKIRLHDLRHTWATLALQAGVDVKVVSERLGHSKTAITLDIYQHVTPGMQTDAAERVAALIWPR